MAEPILSVYHGGTISTTGARATGDIMRLKNFSALAASFAAGLVLCGCASPGTTQRSYHGGQSGYANAAPAFTTVTDPYSGQAYLAPSQQASPYGVQPRMPYGYGAPCAAPMNAGTAIGAVAGFALGRSVGAGNGRVAAEVAGAVVGANLGGQAAASPRPGCR